MSPPHFTFTPVSLGSPGVTNVRPCGWQWFRGCFSSRFLSNKPPGAKSAHRIHHLANNLRLACAATGFAGLVSLLSHFGRTPEGPTIALCTTSIGSPPRESSQIGLDQIKGRGGADSPPASDQRAASARAAAQPCAAEGGQVPGSLQPPTGPELRVLSLCEALPGLDAKDPQDTRVSAAPAGPGGIWDNTTRSQDLGHPKSH